MYTSFVLASYDFLSVAEVRSTQTPLTVQTLPALQSTAVLHSLRHCKSFPHFSGEQSLFSAQVIFSGAWQTVPVAVAVGSPATTPPAPPAPPAPPGPAALMMMQRAPSLQSCDVAQFFTQYP
jgi:hypothetical protein